jgi:hypothetical protein
MILNNPTKFFAKSSIQKYLESDLWSWFVELTTGLRRINFLDNFQSFRLDEVSLPVGVEIALPNGLKNRDRGAIPTSRLIVRQTGNGVITDGSTPWNADEVFLKNEGPDPVVISVIFLI